MTTLPATVTERIDSPPTHPSAPSAAGGTTVTFQDIIAIIKRRIFLILFLFLLLDAMTVGAWIASYKYFPLYPAEAFIECISPSPKAMEIAPVSPDQKEFDRFILTQAHFASNPEILLETLKLEEVKATQWYKDTPGEDLLLDFIDLVKAAPQRGTNLLRISCQTRSPDDPHVIINNVVRQYLNRVREHNTGEFRTEREFRKRDLDKVYEQIVDKEKQLSAIARQLPPGAITMGQNPVASDYQMDRQTVAQYELMFQELNGLYQIYSQPGGAGLSPEDIQLVELDPKVAALSNQNFTVAQQIAVTKKSLGSQHRAVKELQKLLDVINEQLKDERQTRIAEIQVYKREQVKTAMLNAQHALLKAREKLTDTMAHLADMDELLTQYISLQEDIELIKENRETISTYIKELDRIVSERAAIRIESREEALPPLERSFPQKFLIPAGITLSLVLSIAFALLIEFMDTSLRTPQDFVRHLRIPVLGVVPHVDDEEVDIDQIETAVRDAPHSMYAEVFRAIRTNLQFSTTADRQRSILITSPRPEDGKTSIACNLAIMIAQGGRRVLLVDANFRRPNIQRIFPPKDRQGLSNILIGEGTLEEASYGTDIATLDILPSGPMPPNPAELMGGDLMGEFIRNATERYDQVIIDAPPVLLASDASILATRVDGVILVCRAQANTRGIGSRACALLARVNAHVFGGILNAAEVRRGGYFREQLRTFYDYRLDEDDEYAQLPQTALLDDGRNDPDTDRKS